MSPLASPPAPRLQRPLRAALGALALAICALAICAPAAAAEPAGDARKEAERLFLEARAALEQGRRDEACAAFRRSLELAEVANTVFNVARCDEQDGRLLPALRGWERGLALVPPNDERAAAARARAVELEQRIPRLTVTLPPDAPPGARVLLDGAPLDASALGAPTPLPVGDHTVVAEAPGREPRKLPVTLAEGDRQSVLISFGPEQRAGAPPPPPPPPPDAGNTRRTLGFVLGGVGLAGLAAAGVTGGLLLARDAEIKDLCPEPGRCSQGGLDTIDGSKPLLVVNAIAWGVGIAGLGAGAALLITSGGGDAEQRPQAAIAPAALPGGGGLTMVGRF